MQLFCIPFLAAILLTIQSSGFAQNNLLIQEENMPMTAYRGTVNAPEFPSDLDWLNTSNPIRLKDLRGKIVLLDFWTYCCINCMHVLPDLKKLEKKYPEELVVIGVHSAKFATEKESDNIRQAVIRYEIEHPVVNDHQMQVWSLYGVRAWPTLFLIDPEGKVVGHTSGEGIYEPFDQIIAEMIKTFDKKISRNQLYFQLEKEKQPQSILSFPGKVLAHAESQRLYISDSNHNRILISDLNGKVETIIGNGQCGLVDGTFQDAQFNHPQGLSVYKDRLYVADTENHAIREINLTTKQVITLAGNGQQARSIGIPETDQSVPLNSPWDLTVHDSILYIAMAGPHQIWKLDLNSGVLCIHAGNGREACIDGPLKSAALAQPSGIISDGSRLYFADSETSSIRIADINPKGSVRTLVGLDLFEFGDKDGIGTSVRLQHPLGITLLDGVLYITDTYNNKIKKINPADNSSWTVAGSGQAGNQDGSLLSARFDEPGGLSGIGNHLYIADTNNHLIRIIDLNKKEVATLDLQINQ